MAEVALLEQSYPTPAWEEAPPLGIVYRLAPEDRRWWDAEIRTLFDAEGRRLAARVRAGIRAQSWDWPELNEAYAAWKDEQGYDPRMLIATGEYLGAIVHRPIPYGFEVGVALGVHNPSELEYRLLGTWLEYGTSRMPARPHFRPAIEAWKEEDLPSFEARLAERLARHLRRRMREMMGAAAYGPLRGLV